MKPLFKKQLIGRLPREGAHLVYIGDDLVAFEPKTLDIDSERLFVQRKAAKVVVLDSILCPFMPLDIATFRVLAHPSAQTVGKCSLSG